MTRHERVLEILNTAIGGSTVEIGVHRAFWRGLTRDEFIAKRVRGLPMVDLVGGGAVSTIVRALKGEAPFGADLPVPPDGAEFSRMPAGLPPVPDEDIAFIQQWIDDGCPEDEFLVAASNLVWLPTNAPVASSRTDDIWFISPEVGWAVNSNGQIIHTRDGGDTWEVQLQAPSPTYFRCIGFANETRGWCGTLTAPRRMFHTENGGSSWEQVTNLPALAPSAVCGMSVVSDQVVFASGTNYPNRPTRIMKTVDGGQTWTAWEMEPWADLLVDCYFTSPTTGWVVGGKSPVGNPNRANVKPVVLFTNDGGASWENRVANLEFPPGEWGWKIFFLNEQIGFVSLENFDEGAILKTTNGGLSWVRLPINDPQRNANLEGIGFINENVGWVGGWGDADFERKGSSFTVDGGLNWSDAKQIGLAINRFRFFGNPVTVGYASGETVYKLSNELPTQAVMANLEAATVSRRSPARVVRAAQPTGIPIPFGEVPVGAEIQVAIFGRFGDVLWCTRAVAGESMSVLWEPEPETIKQAILYGGNLVRVESARFVHSYRLSLTQ